MRPDSREGLVVARHGHADEAHGDGAGFRCGDASADMFLLLTEVGLRYLSSPWLSVWLGRVGLFEDRVSYA